VHKEYSFLRALNSRHQGTFYLTSALSSNERPRLSNSVFARGHPFNSEPEEREDAAEVLNSSATYQARGLQNKTSKESLRNV
jgi:hypothetical protein